MLITDLAFFDWPIILPNAGSSIALIDQLIHHAEIILIEGDSYRGRAAEQTRKASRSKRIYTRPADSERPRTRVGSPGRRSCAACSPSDERGIPVA